MFNWLCKNTSRVGIVTEGDSWFSYPKKNILFGRDANIIDHVVSTTKGKDKANILRLESSGDEAVEIIAGRQKHRLAEILKKNAQYINLLLFSGGGNDVVGKWDMERLLNTYQQGYSAKQCINQTRLNRKLRRVSLAYEELNELRKEYAPHVIIITHTYDLVMPSSNGAVFLWGLVKTKPWIYPYLVQKGIPARLHFAVTKQLLVQLKDELLRVAARPAFTNHFYVVNTQGTLRPGHKSDWINEIHPSSSGFKRIAKLIWAEARKHQQSLPAMS